MKVSKSNIIESASVFYSQAYNQWTYSAKLRLEGYLLEIPAVYCDTINEAYQGLIDSISKSVVRFEIDDPFKKEEMEGDSGIMHSFPLHEKGQMMQLLSPTHVIDLINIDHRDRLVDMGYAVHLNGRYSVLTEKGFNYVISKGWISV